MIWDWKPSMSSADIMVISSQALVKGMEGLSFRSLGEGRFRDYPAREYSCIEQGEAPHIHSDMDDDIVHPDKKLLDKV